MNSYINHVRSTKVNPANTPQLAWALTVSVILVSFVIAWTHPILVGSFMGLCVYSWLKRKPVEPVQPAQPAQPTEPQITDPWDGEVTESLKTVELIKSVPTVCTYLALPATPTVDTLLNMSYGELKVLAIRYGVKVCRAKRDLIKSLTTYLA